MSLRVSFIDGSAKLGGGPVNLVGSNDGGRGEEKMVAGESIDAALHGIDEQAALEGGFGDTPSKIHLGRERLLGFLVGNKFNRPEKTEATHVAHTRAVAELV